MHNGRRMPASRHISSANTYRDAETNKTEHLESEGAQRTRSVHRIYSIYNTCQVHACEILNTLTRSMQIRVNTPVSKVCQEPKRLVS